MHLLQVRNVYKQHADSVVVKDISFTTSPLEKIAISGATGSGKTTLLKIIAGLIQPTSGEVFFKNEKVKGPEERLIPGHSKVAFLSQHFELRNNYTVIQLLNTYSKIEEQKAERIYDLCRIDHLLQRWTHQLSGGERQRIALAAVLVTEPELILLDEPYSNLDPIHKSILKNVINDISNLNVSVVLVSHDASDVLPWADKVLTLENGSLIQSGLPVEVYSNPDNLYVAALFGKFASITPALKKSFHLKDSNRKILRPSDIKIGEEGVKGTVVKNEYFGDHYQAEVMIDESVVYVNHQLNHLRVGNTVLISLNDH